MKTFRSERRTTGTGNAVAGDTENAKPRAAVPDELCNCTTLRKAARHVSGLYDRALAPSGLRVTQYAILAELGRSGPMTITELARAMVMERNGLGHNLRPLEREGLVSMEIGGDRRSRVILLTRSGRARLANAKTLWQQAQDRFGAVFGPDRVQALRSLLIAATTAEYGDLATGR
ncbi:MAG TPA: MarR family winged helix-turn-helix transcriptional regulator [Acetobacteraceae bacterium]|nr:MarR family winged helix-turn-helix transcriptional regulator [Acetobacteraceae bacterium]